MKGVVIGTLLLAMFTTSVCDDARPIFDPKQRILVIRGVFRGFYDLVLTYDEGQCLVDKGKEFMDHGDKMIHYIKHKKFRKSVKEAKRTFTDIAKILPQCLVGEELKKMNGKTSQVLKQLGGKAWRRAIKLAKNAAVHSVDIFKQTLKAKNAMANQDWLAEGLAVGKILNWVLLNGKTQYEFDVYCLDDHIEQISLPLIQASQAFETDQTIKAVVLAMEGAKSARQTVFQCLGNQEEVQNLASELHSHLDQYGVACMIDGNCEEDSLDLDLTCLVNVAKDVAGEVKVVLGDLMRRDFDQAVTDAETLVHNVVPAVTACLQEQTESQKLLQ